ncbi:hypothetical protein JCM11641_001730 [Rhodosporidiobolus odoratus]
MVSVRNPSSANSLAEDSVLQLMPCALSFFLFPGLLLPRKSGTSSTYCPFSPILPAQVAFSLFSISHVAVRSGFCIERENFQVDLHELPAMIVLQQTMQLHTFLYIVLGMPIVIAASRPDASSFTVSKRKSSSSRISRATRRSPYTSHGSSFFVPSASKLPLTALATRSDRNSDIHPQVLLQQHVNRGVKRHAKMTKRSLGADNAQVEQQLRNKIKKRWESVQPASSAAATAPIERRWRAVEGLAGASAAVQHMKERVASILSSSRQATTAEPVNAGASIAPLAREKAVARVGVSGYAGASVAAQRGDAQQNSTTSDASAAPTNETQPEDEKGYSQLDLDAAMNNTISEPANVTAANSLGLAIEANDVGYFAEVQLGSNNRTFKVLMDSGSADFWVPSAACLVCGNHTSLGPFSSTTYRDTGLPWSVTYGTGDVGGTTVTDDAIIAGLRISQLEFGAVTQESDDFSDPSVPFDGLMGLARSSLSSQNVPTPIERLASDGTVLSAQMGYKLGRVSDGKNDGEVTFGGVDGSKYQGEITQVQNVNTQGFWEASLSLVTVDNTTLFTSSAMRTAILDTGTTLMIAPKADAEAIHAAIPGSRPDGQGGFTLPCTTESVLSLSFGGVAFPILPSDLTFLPLSDDLEGDCISSISSGDVGGQGEWLVGAAFLKNVYFATDVGSNMIGLAHLA